MRTLILPDGCGLRLFDSAPATAPCGSVLLVHGLGEHSGRYDALAAWWLARGWRVLRYDQRGHGQSDGPRGGLPAHDSLLLDLGQVIADLNQRRSAADERGPLLLLGHSMGGLVAGRFVAEGQQPLPAPWWRPVQGLVLSSPALDLVLNAGQKALLAVLGTLAPNLAVGNGLNPAWVSRDPAVVQAYRDDPLVHDRISARLVRCVADEGRRLRALAPFWALPTLLLWAGADRCVSPSGSAEFAAAAPPAQVQAQVFPALAHEIFNEPEKDQVLAVLGHWLDTHIAA